MNTAQTQLYWRTWSAVIRSHGWRGGSAALAASRQDCWISPQLDPVYQTVWRAALELALREGRSATADDLRHACHIVALGHSASSKRFTNAEFDRVLALFRLLAEPDSLTHLQAWQDSDAGERRRQFYVIQRAPPKYWQAIARDKFGHADLDRLSLYQLRQLSLTLRQRARARAGRATVPAPATTEPCPA